MSFRFGRFEWTARGRLVRRSPVGVERVSPLPAKREKEREKIERKKGKENVTPVSPPLMPGERLWRRPGTYCCFPRRGGGRKGSVRSRAEGGTIISQHPPSRRTSPYGATATSNRDACRPTEWMKEGAGWTETSAAKGTREQADRVGATASEIGV